MIFGIVMTPTGWLIAGIITLFMMFVPFFIVEAVAETLPDPLQPIVIIVGCYIIVPLLITYWYRHKMKNTGRGDAIFWIYCGLFLLMFAIFTLQLFTKPLSFDSIAGPLVTGSVAAYMIYTAKKIKTQVNEAYIKQNEILRKMEREEDIQRQAEAILLAEKMKNEQWKG